ncbi:uncharacterized protein BYT42DRAFT_551041 [Radiomyces spectabilis]|uniref:uncharacterized protein n=1 Tax=Radiomyces spectabilis TaxID=64574 RepID=UPI002220DDB2|nr:uncharacterized protein BYT42DRAFT_551041 [Radiomyces spectabilis]KAI8393439.1 hypothetical protein BYT42DRAFT_551041 [Radiomyces spectabilis]
MNILSTPTTFPMDINHTSTSEAPINYFSPSTPNDHLYSDCCGYCHHDIFNYPYGEDSCPFYNVYQPKPLIEEPFHYNYLLNLFTAPDMKAYLMGTGFSEDVYALPIHLQRLISEAKEEVVIESTKANQVIASQPSFTALSQLERVRNFVWMCSDGDVANLMQCIIQLISDEDELENLLGH